MEDVTRLLNQARSGDREALESVLPFVYRELKKIAAHHLDGEWHGEPLETTALVHEAYLRLAGGAPPDYHSRSHFFGIASRLMRQVLVDMARARAAKKRAAPSLPLDSAVEVPLRSERTLIALDDALSALSTEAPIKATLIEMRYFGGMTAEESARETGLTVLEVRRHLRLATAWLHKEISRTSAAP